MEQQHSNHPNDRAHNAALATQALLDQTSGDYSTEIVQAPTLVTHDRDGTPLQFWSAMVQICVPGKGSRCGTGSAPADHPPQQALDDAFIEAAKWFGIHAEPKPDAPANGRRNRAAKRTPDITPYIVRDLECLKRFHRLHGNGPTWIEMPFQQGTAFGKAVHRVLAKALDPRFGTPPHARFLATWCRDAICDPDGTGSNYPDAQMEQEDVRRCHRVVLAVIAAEHDATHTVGVEHQFSVRMRDEQGAPLFRIRPRADRLVVRPDDPDTLAIIDYKVIRNGNGHPTHREQAALLVAAADAEMSGSGRLPQLPNVSFETWRIDDRDGGIVVDRLGVEDLRETYDLVRGKIMRYVEAKAYPAEPGAHCGKCPLKDGCPEAQDVDVPLTHTDRRFR